MANPQQVAACIAYLTAACRNFHPSDATLAVWCEEFEQTYHEDLQAACKAFVRASKHNSGPPIGELLERAGEARRQREQRRPVTAKLLQAPPGVQRAMPQPSPDPPPATPEQVRQRCKEALAKIAAAPDIGGPNQKRGPAPIQAALKAAIQAIAPPKAREDTPW